MLVHDEYVRDASTTVEPKAAYGRPMVAAPRGDADLAAVGALVADPRRCRMLLALDDGRALPASTLAAEAGVTPATASSHLHKLTAAGLLAIETHGRYRYYRLAGPTVARLIETLGTLSPAAPIRSLRQDTRAAALRRARTCYDHLAGRLGVALMAAFLHRGWMIGGDGTFHADTADHDRLSAPGHDLDYALTPCGRDFLDEVRRRPPASPATRPLLRRLDRATPPPRRWPRPRPARARHEPRVGPADPRQPRGRDHRRWPRGAERHVRHRSRLTGDSLDRVGREHPP